MDWTALNHALLAHLPVAAGLLLPWPLLAAQRPGRGIRNWWTVSRYLGWMGLLGLLAAMAVGFLDAQEKGLLAPHHLFAAWGKASPEGILARHMALGLACLPLAVLALWSMHRPRKDHDSLGLLTLLLGLLWAACLLATGRAGYRLAHGVKVPPAVSAPVPVAVAKAAPAPDLSSADLPARLLDFASLESLHEDPVKSMAHGGRWIRVWASSDAVGAYRTGQPLPVGARVVMSSQEDRWGRPGPGVGPLYGLEQTASGPRLSFYWGRIPTERRQEFLGEARAYWHDQDPHLEACRACHDKGMADPAKRSHWRQARVPVDGSQPGQVRAQ